MFAQTWATEIGELGYRAPLSDLDSFENGGDGRLDIYLADVGAEALFGWCTSDDPASYATYRVSAFCVIDEDYTNRAFGIDPLPALKATAAHEFFHAVQFGYDWLEDLWLMEGTAAWIEDEVFDGVNDNLRYARQAQPDRLARHAGRPRPRRLRVRRLDLLALPLGALRPRAREGRLEPRGRDRVGELLLARGHTWRAGRAAAAPSATSSPASARRT